MPIIVDPSTPSAEVSALDLITVAAEKLGVIGQGESLSAADANSGLRTLNSLIQFLAIDKLLIHHVSTVQYTWPSNTRTRTIGSGANIDTSWPSRIESGTFFRDSNDIDYHPTVTHDAREYERISYKFVAGAYPEVIYYDRAYPTGTLKIYPYPSESMTLFLLCWQPLQSFATLATGLSLPPGYRYLLENRLAVEFESVFGLPCPASVVNNAKMAVASLKRVNATGLVAAQTDAVAALGSVGRSDIISGE